MNHVARHRARFAALSAEPWLRRGKLIRTSGHLKLLSGDGERDEMEDHLSFTASSRTTYVAQHLVFAAVMADAAMVAEFVKCAVYGVPRGSVARGAQARRG